MDVKNPGPNFFGGGGGGASEAGIPGNPGNPAPTTAGQGGDGVQVLIGGPPADINKLVPLIQGQESISGLVVVAVVRSHPDPPEIGGTARTRRKRWRW